MGADKKIRDPRERGRLRRKHSIRKRIHGTPERPRLSVFRSLNHVYAQAVDDLNNRVVASSSDAGKKDAAQFVGKDKKTRARIVGEMIAATLKEKRISTVVFDRNGYIYHGRVQEVAKGAREAGLTF